MIHLKPYNHFSEKQNESLETKINFLFKISMVFNVLAPIISLFLDYLKTKSKLKPDIEMSQKIYEITGEKVDIYFNDHPTVVAYAASGYIAYNSLYKEVLPERELIALLLHEIGHLKNKDLVKERLMDVFVHIPFIFWTKPGIWFLYFLFSKFFYKTGYFSQKREFQADSYTSEFGYQADFASFLVRMDNYTSNKNTYTDIVNKTNNIFRRFNDLFKTHPRIYDRLKKLYLKSDNKEKFLKDIIYSTQQKLPLPNPSEVETILKELEKES